MMKATAIAIFALGVTLQVSAQQKEGKIIYDRTLQMQIRIADDNEPMNNMLPRSRTDKFELSFANNQSLWKQMEQDDREETVSDGGGGGMTFRMIGPGSDDIMYSNLEASKRVEARELGTKKFIVEDSIRRMDWKLSDESKTILGHVCRKAISSRIGSRTMMMMDNGKMERKEIADTSQIVAWFTSDIPMSIGPGEFQGQLPGAILEVDVNNGRQTYKAVEISPKVEIASIKEPKGSKRISPAEFNKERDKMFEEMSRNNGGPGRTIRIQN